MQPIAYDLVVIGSGPAGEKGAAQAAYFGKRVALIERESVLGGAGANTGTLPSKTLRETALVLSGLRARGLYGVDLSLRRQATVADFLYHERRVSEAERDRVGQNLERHGVDLYEGLASFVDAHTLKVEAPSAQPLYLRGEKILIATGSSPRRPTTFRFDDPRVYDSDSILRLPGMPRQLLVIGGGVIGSEYACTFAALGVSVQLVDSRSLLLDFLDHEVARALMARMSKLGIDLVLPDGVEACLPGPEAVSVRLTSGRELCADAVLVAAGRVSNTAELNLQAAGIECGERGLLRVDAQYRTSVPHIYAAGDVIGFPALAATSMEQARLAICDAFDLQYKKEVAPILPFGIYTIPEVSMCGETEESAQRKRIDYVCGETSYGANARGMIIGESDGFLKLLFRREDLRLIGVHVIGECASELVHIGLTAMMLGATHEVFIRSCYNYPTLSELYKYATYDAMGRRQRLASHSVSSM